MKKKVKTRSKRKFSNKFMPIFISLIFVSSLFGFALSMSFNNSKINKKNIPFTTLTDKYGNKIYYEKVNNIEFYFYQDLPNLFINESIHKFANTIKNSTYVEIYDNSYKDSGLLLRKALNAIKVPYKEIDNDSCINNRIIFSKKKLNGSCINLYGTNTDVYLETEKLVYLLLR